MERGSVLRIGQDELVDVGGVAVCRECTVRHG